MLFRSVFFCVLTDVGVLLSAWDFQAGVRARLAFVNIEKMQALVAAVIRTVISSTHLLACVCVFQDAGH